MSDCPSTEWRTLLEHAVAASSVTDVARRLGVARSSLSLLLNGKYPGGTDKMAERVMATLAVCPVYLGPRSGEICAVRHAAPVPTSNPFALRQWRECQQCNFWSDNNER